MFLGIEERGIVIIPLSSSVTSYTKINHVTTECIQKIYTKLYPIHQNVFCIKN